MSTERSHTDHAAPTQGFAAYDTKDARYGGAASVVHAEREHLKQRQDATGNPPDKLIGLALSGGGIRSATFALGAAQAMARHGWLKRFDYLSTVSGGGYTGASLSWLWHKKWDLSRHIDEIKHKLGWDNPPETLGYGVAGDSFPYGTHRKGKGGSASGPDKIALLRFLRQHGKYLTPGKGIGLPSLLAVILRGMFLNAFIYLSLLTMVFLVFTWAGFLSPLCERNQCPISSWLAGAISPAFGALNPALLVAVAGLATFALWSLFYSLMTYFASRPSSENSQRWYRGRRRFEENAGELLVIIAALALIGTLPYVDDWLLHLGKQFSMTWLKETASGVSAVIGVIGGVWAFFKSGEQGGSSLGTTVLTWVALICLGYGLLLIGYQIAQVIDDSSSASWAFPALALSVVLGWFANVNYISIHRYYRDRLMEAFMPDVATALTCEAEPSYEADKDRLHDMCRYDQKAVGPYHIINANVVLVDALRTKYRGRGGDNFILTPLYCGSSATGWRQTHQFMAGRMNLSSAMAISGAAVNPNTGSGGEGPTRNRLLSILMALLNIRLGYWAQHPNPEFEPARWIRPNYFCPGLRELLPGGLNEHHRFLQLSDGGHFENLGLYELIRRRLALIVVCDGSADPDYTFSDFANLQEKVRADFGVNISIDFSPMMPQTPLDFPKDTKASARGHVIGKIHYPDGSQGTLIYLNTVLTPGLPADLYGYKSSHKSFPDQSTADQFFDEKQFEAYRELGYRLAEAMINDPEVANALS